MCECEEGGNKQSYSMVVLPPCYTEYKPHCCAT